MTRDWLRYQNQRATRNRPLSPELEDALSFLPELGIGVEVFSGGQSSKAEGGRRTGSTRHDHGHAADVFFTKDGRRLDWSNPEDLPLFTEIVQRGKAAGLTGFGAGDGYMQPGSMHVGFGSPGVWGAGGRGANAPDWLRAAYGEAPTGSAGETQMAGRGRGDAMLYGGAGGDTLGTAPTGGLGGLGGTAEPPAAGGLRGFIGSPEFGDMLQAFGASLMSSPSNAPLAGFGAAMGDMQDRRMRREHYADQRAERREARQDKLDLLQEARAEDNMTKSWLRRTYPDLADQIDAGLPISEGLKIAQERRKTEAGGTVDLGLNPQYGVDANGNPVLLQLGKDGKVVQSAMPEGVTLSKEPIRLDAGTHFVLLDPITRQPIGQIPKENRQEAAETAAGTVEGRTAAERAASAGTDATNAQNALDLLKDIREDPNLDRGTGFSSHGNWIRGTGGYDFENKVEQAKNGAFLQAIQQMKGLGALSNNEGQAATSAITRMNVATSKEAFLAALDDYEKIVRQGLERAQRYGASGSPAAPPPTPADAAPPRRRAFNPATGAIE